jgi:hypothetical protein
MKIQEMKSGARYLGRRTNAPTRKNVFQMKPLGEAIFEDPVPNEIGSELEKPIWSVASPAAREAGGMTYRQASDLLEALEASDMNGLCIVTDEAAARL